MLRLIYDKENNVYYFIDENGNKSESYAFAMPYFKGYALVQKEKGKGYYYRNEAGKLSQKFNEADSFDESGFARVKRTKNSPYQFIDTDFNFSEEVFSFADSYSEGFARVQYTNSGKYYFRDTNGKVSEDGYGDASRYREGFASVSEKRMGGGKHWYRDLNGNLSEPFRIALDYKNGFAVVSLLNEDGKFRLRDKSGNFSEDSYYYIDNGSFSLSAPPKGFFKVKDSENSPEKYRDYLGNVTNEPTQKGLDYILYVSDEKSVFDLDTTCFGDDKFLKAIMDKEQNMLLQASEHCITEEDMKQVGELADFTGDFIRNKAYEAHLLLQEEAKKQKLENSRKDLQNHIGKMF